jgi:multisubunit Na+/H+ antiporter MnhB subunit
MNAQPSPIFAAVARLAFFVLNLFAAYLLLRGHNAPGGGFIAGLVTAISFVMLSLALGWDEARRILPVDPLRFAYAGLGLATATTAAPLAWGRPLLEHFMVHVQAPVFGKLHFGTPLAFDTGVFLVVVGITCKMVFVLGRSVDGVPALSTEEQARYAAEGEEPIERPPAGEEVRRAD